MMLIKRLSEADSRTTSVRADLEQRLARQMEETARITALMEWERLRRIRLEGEVEYWKGKAVEAGLRVRGGGWRNASG
jgi:pyridoxine/pyridoxamine 5'-phosphate oxidase